MGDREQQVKRWLVKAEHDLRTAATMLGVDDPTTDTICFHCQQCFEKCLKAFLCMKDRDIPRTHDLVAVLEVCLEYDGGFGALRPAAQELTDYAIEPRYPDEWRDIPESEAAGALEKAKSAMAFVKRSLTVDDVPPSR